MTKPRIEPATMAVSEGTILDTEIVAPVHELVQDTFDVIRHEVKILRRTQASGQALHKDDVVRLQRLMNALSKAHRSQLDAIEAEDLSKLDRAALVRELRAELTGKAPGSGIVKTG